MNAAFFCFLLLCALFHIISYNRFFVQKRFFFHISHTGWLSHPKTYKLWYIYFPPIYPPKKTTSHFSVSFCAEKLFRMIAVFIVIFFPHFCAGDMGCVPMSSTQMMCAEKRMKLAPHLCKMNITFMDVIELDLTLCEQATFKFNFVSSCPSLIHVNNDVADICPVSSFIHFFSMNYC